MKSMGKTLAILAVSAASLALGAPAQAAYTLVNSGDAGGNGYVTTSATGFDLFGTDSPDGIFGNYTTVYFDTATTAGTVSFDYTYTTNDLTQDSFFDPAGFYYNGNFIQLTPADGGLATVTGSYTQTVSVGDTFGFYVNSTGVLGRADINVTFADAVPEPAAWATMVLGLGLAGGAMRRTSRRRTHLDAVA